jgi:N-acetylmuramoyl-L-alanine amidase
MKIAMSVGHGQHIRGASGYLDEVDEAVRVVTEVANKLRQMGVGIVTYYDTISTSQNENLNRIVDWHNQQTRDLDVSVHFNAYQTTSKPMGAECLYVTQSQLAGDVSNAIAVTADLPDRGAKYRSDLFFLNNTAKPAILIETCFVDSSADAEHYRTRFAGICMSIAEAISGEPFIEEPPEPPEAVVPPPELTSENRVDITSEVEGHVAIRVNGSMMVGSENYDNIVDLKVDLVGDVVVVVNGQTFHNKPPETVIAPNHASIEATVFGGSDDPNNSAYPPYELLDGDTEDFVALPFSWDLNLFPDNAPQVRVYHGELSAIGRVADKGPWTTDDEAYVMGTARPIAETCHEEGTPLPTGPNAGKVPTNAAGIDLSPHLAAKIGIDGKGHVDWAFVETNSSNNTWRIGGVRTTS